MFNNLYKMDNIIKYKLFDIIKFNNGLYDDNILLIQSPLINDYSIINHNTTKYLQLKLETDKQLQFLTSITAIETKLRTEKTQIITDILNNKFLKVKFDNNTILFDSNYNQIKKFTNNKIILLLKLEYFEKYYYWTIVQGLEI